MVVRVLALMFLPGTIIHELAHLLFAGVMFVPVGEMNVFPEIEESGVKLGSVQIGKTDLFRRAVVGVAPILFGILCILMTFYMLREVTHLVWWQALLALYLVFEIGNTMFSSRKDAEGLIGFTVVTLTIVLIVLVPLYFLRPLFLENAWIYLNNLNLEFISNLFKQVDTYLIAPVVIDIVVIVLVRLLL